MMLPIGKLTKFDHNVQKRVPVYLPTVSKLDSWSEDI